MSIFHGYDGYMFHKVDFKIMFFYITYTKLTLLVDISVAMLIRKEIGKT